MVLLFFKVDYIPKLFANFGWQIPWPEKMPMSTTWVFLGLLAGREFGMWLRLRLTEFGGVRRTIVRDLAKVTLGAAVSLVVAFGLPYLAPTVAQTGANAPPAAASEPAAPSEPAPSEPAP